MGVFLEEVEDGISGLLGCHLGGLAAEGGEGLVLLGAGNLSLQEMGGIAFDLDVGAGLTHDEELGKVWEDDDEGGGLGDGHGIAELALGDADGVEGPGSVDTIDVKFSLAEALEGAFEDEVVMALAAGSEQQDNQGEEQEPLHGARGYCLTLASSMSRAA